MTDRMERINAALQEVLAQAIPHLSDPRIALTTVTAVRTSPDLRFAKVFVSILADDKRREKTLTALNTAHGVLQAAIARELTLKRTPKLTFAYDETVEAAVLMTKRLEAPSPLEAAGASQEEPDAAH